MNSILHSVAENAGIFLLAEGAGLALLLIAVITLWVRVRRLEGFRRRADMAVSSTDAGAFLANLGARTSDIEMRLDGAEKDVQHALRTLTRCVQHVGLVRYDAFQDVGGQQSFSAALLDERQSGVVLTAIYSRTDVRFYAKSLDHGRPSVALTPEEVEAVKMALGSAS